MQPIPIPQATVDKGEPLGWVRKVIVGPDGDLTGEVRPVEALIGFIPTGDGQVRPEFNILIQIEDDDRPLLEKFGGRFWLTFTGHVVPFSLSVFDPEGDDVDAD